MQRGVLAVMWLYFSALHDSCGAHAIASICGIRTNEPLRKDDLLKVCARSTGWRFAAPLANFRRTGCLAVSAGEVCIASCNKCRHRGTRERGSTAAEQTMRRNQVSVEIWDVDTRCVHWHEAQAEMFEESRKEGFTQGPLMHWDCLYCRVCFETRTFRLLSSKCVMYCGRERGHGNWERMFVINRLRGTFQIRISAEVSSSTRTLIVQQLSMPCWFLDVVQLNKTGLLTGLFSLPFQHRHIPAALHAEVAVVQGRQRSKRSSVLPTSSHLTPGSKILSTLSLRLYVGPHAGQSLIWSGNVWVCACSVWDDLPYITNVQLLTWWRMSMFP